MASLVVMAVLSSCTAAGDGRQKPEPQARLPFRRDCDETVWGKIGRGYRAHSTVVGPLTFVRLPRLAHARREIRPGRKVFPTKVLVTLRKGHSALVEVPGSVAAWLRLTYNPEQWAQRGKTLVTTGQRAVQFVACPHGRGGPGATQFNGGFLVGRIGCHPLDISIDDRPARRVVVSFAAGRCNQG